MVKRSNGGMRGVQNRTTSAVAAGAWSMDDVQQSSLARNWPGQPAAQVPNAPSFANAVSFTAYISGTNMTVTAVSTGTLAANQFITGAGVSQYTRIVSQTSGTTGGAGVYVVNISQTVGSSGSPVSMNVNLTLATNTSISIPYILGYDGGSPVTGVTATVYNGSTPVGTATGTSSPLTVTGLPAGSVLSTALYATNSVGNSTPSTGPYFKTPGPPAAPTIGTATLVGSNGASITFTPPTDNGGSPITGATAVSSPGGITGTSSGTSPISVSNLVPGTTYTFTVYCTNALGNGASSAASNSISTSSENVGGNVTWDGAYTVNTFTSSQTFGVGTDISSANVLVVAGGGSGGPAYYGGGGGAGGLVYTTGIAIPKGLYSVTVGAGGAAQPNGNTLGNNGLNSSISGLAIAAAIGGGGGASYSAGNVGANGGSGGGASAADGYSGAPVSTPGSGTSGQGYAGGTNGGYGTTGLYGSGGGGGGAGGGGYSGMGNNTGTVASQGKNITFSITNNTTLTITAVTNIISGTPTPIRVGNVIEYGGASNYPTITAQVSGTPGGVGVYKISPAVTNQGAGTTGHIYDPVGQGGDGLAYDIVTAGSPVYYAGGGGSGGYWSGSAVSPSGGFGGGGYGGGYSRTPAAGAANTGGGGGGGGVSSGGAAGGSGVVIVRYLTGVVPSLLIVAGGGGGGVGNDALSGGGGGGGGVQYRGQINLVAGTTYVATVGAGGAGRLWNNGTIYTGGDGDNSVLSYGGTTITAVGGGGGGSVNTSASGRAGGSGGGGGQNFGTYNGAGGAGTSGQGNAGGSVTGGYTGFYSSAGGGGAGAVGTSVPDGTTKGIGGIGKQYYIPTYTTTYFAGGGGGSLYGNPATDYAAGGLGGGGNGGVYAASTSTTSGQNGTANTGGGGGGALNNSTGLPTVTSGNGGTGVIILSIPTAQYSGNQTGATVTTSGSYTILTFNSSGSYTH